MRVLIISDACNPERPSLPSFAYKYALAISKYADVVLATQIRNAAGIKKIGMGNVEVVYLNTERIVGVVVEAMACGRACIVVDYGGPATLVPDNCGIKVPIGTAENILKQFKHELEQLVTNPDVVKKMGIEANKHAITYYTWDVKARKTIEIYNWITGSQKEKPDYWNQPVTYQPVSELVEPI